MDSIRGIPSKSKVQIYHAQRKMEPLVLLIVTLQNITYYPCGSWSQSNRVCKLVSFFQILVLIFFFPSKENCCYTF